MAPRTPSERLLPFTDAVVAIAMTLLVLPLVEIGVRAGEQGVEFGDTSALLDVLGESVAPLIGFAISFFVIARLWWAHHAIFGGVREWSTGLVVANTLWLFTIVLLPWTTSLSTAYLGNRLVALLYVGTMTASCALQTVMARIVWLRDRSAAARERYLGNLTTLVAFAVALVLCVAFPFTFYAPLALLAFTPLVDRAVNRRVEAAARR